MTSPVSQSGNMRFPGKAIVRVVALLVVIIRGNLAYPADDAETLQKQGIRRIDEYIASVSRTGDFTSRILELQKAQNELTASSNQFLARQDFAAAALCFIKLGDIERLQKHWNPAFQFYTRALQLAKQADNAGYQAKALNQLARTELLGLQDLQSAADHSGQAVRMATAAGNKDYLFDALDLASQVEVRRGNLAAAADYLERALQMKDELQDKILLMYGYMDRADVFYNRGGRCDFETDFDICDQALTRSQADYEQALGIARDSGFQFLVGQLQGLVQNVDARHKLLRSQSTYAQNTALKVSVLLHPKKPSDVLVTERFAGGPDPKLQATIQALLPRFDNADPRSLYGQGMSEEMNGNNDAAIAAFGKAIELLERDRRNLRDDQSRGTFLEDKINFYYAPALLLLDLRREAEAFDLMERSRSRGMADLLASSPLSLRTARERELFSQSLQLKSQIADQQVRLFASTAAGERTRRAQEIAKLEGQLQKVQGQIAKDAPKLLELSESQPVSLESAKLSAKQESYDLLYYLVVEHAVIVWDINGDGVKVLNVFLPRSEVTAKVAALANSLVAQESNPGKLDEQTSRELFLFLIQPIIKFVKNRHLIIVPHEDLYNLPFQVLQNPADGRYLGEQFQISYAPSATVLGSLKKKPNLATGRLLAVAGRLAYAPPEVEAVGRFYPGRSKIVKDTPVSKEDVKTWVADYDLVHLSVHGAFNAEKPLLSYLEFPPYGQESGHFTAAEMFGLPLRNGSFVALSACETGQVEATHANEILGAVRALLYAGANNLVLSSWRVADSPSTVLWMETFYRAAQTNPPSEAARLALMAVKSRPEYSDAYFWGPFFVIGK